VEETRVIARILADEGVDAFNVTAGTVADFNTTIPSYFMPPAFNLSNIEAVKRSVKIPVIACGLIHEPEIAEEILAEGRADMIGLGRPLIADPHWVNKVRAGRLDEIHTCIACTRCVDEILTSENRFLKCTVNPLVGREGERKTHPVKRRKKVLVVGGGLQGFRRHRAFRNGATRYSFTKRRRCLEASCARRPSRQTSIESPAWSAGQRPRQEAREPD